MTEPRRPPSGRRGLRGSHCTTAFAQVALFALVGLGSALLEESFVHTDDGCAVEVHCLACRLSAGGATILATVPILASATIAFTAPVSLPLPAPRAVAPSLFRPRAPPPSGKPLPPPAC